MSKRVGGNRSVARKLLCLGADDEFDTFELLRFFGVGESDSMEFNRIVDAVDDDVESTVSEFSSVGLSIDILER